MKSLILIVLLALAACTYGQTSLKQGPTVEGLSLGASRDEVIKKLGKPSSEKKGEADECVGGTEMTLKYPGLEFRLWDDSEEPGKFTVGAFEVTSQRWDVSGVRVGQSGETVKKLFGTSYTTESEKGGRTIWYYAMDENEGPGNTNFTIRNGKIINIYTMWLMC